MIWPLDSGMLPVILWWHCAQRCSSCHCKHQDQGEQCQYQPCGRTIEGNGGSPDGWCYEGNILWVFTSHFLALSFFVWTDWPNRPISLQTQCLKTINSYHASICAATSPPVAENARGQKGVELSHGESRPSSIWGKGWATAKARKHTERDKEESPGIEMDINHHNNDTDTTKANSTASAKPKSSAGHMRSGSNGMVKPTSIMLETHPQLAWPSPITCHLQL